MSAEVEQQLRAAFGRLPKPSREASARARSAALAAIGPSGGRSSSVLVPVFVAAAFAVGAGAAALAATGNLRVDIGARQKPARPVPTLLSVPPGSHGLALVAGGKLWLATRNGLRIEGMPVSAAELSPRALYAVVGLGSSLVALAPGNRRPWVHPTGGRVAAASWSPDGLKIAYVVARPGGYQLRIIEGDGSPDGLLVGHVGAVKPSWRPDALAVAYVDSRGRAAVYDLATGKPRTFDTQKCVGRARASSGSFTASPRRAARSAGRKRWSACTRGPRRSRSAGADSARTRHPLVTLCAARSRRAGVALRAFASADPGRDRDPGAGAVPRQQTLGATPGGRCSGAARGAAGRDGHHRHWRRRRRRRRRSPAWALPPRAGHSDRGRSLSRGRRDAEGRSVTDQSRCAARRR